MFCPSLEYYVGHAERESPTCTFPNPEVTDYCDNINIHVEEKGIIRNNFLKDSDT